MTHTIKQSEHPAVKLEIDTELEYEQRLEDARDIQAEMEKGRKS